MGDKLNSAAAPFVNTTQLMTGNAATMTIPQLDKAIDVLKKKLADKDIQKNSTLVNKVNNLLYDYTKAKNKILRYYEKTLRKNPELVRGKKNTLTLIQVMRNGGKFKNWMADRKEGKHEKWAYNFADFAKDINLKGLGIGVGVTLGAIGAMKAAGMQPFLTALSQFLTANPLISAGIAITSIAVIVPKIAKTIQKVKNNKTAARELNSQILQETAKKDFDAKADSIEQIKDALKENPDMLEAFRAADAATMAAWGFKSNEIIKINNAIERADLELAAESGNEYAVGMAVQEKKEIEDAFETIKNTEGKRRTNAEIEKEALLLDNQKTPLNAEMSNPATTAERKADVAILIDNINEKVAEVDAEKALDEATRRANRKEYDKAIAILASHGFDTPAKIEAEMARRATIEAGKKAIAAAEKSI